MPLVPVNAKKAFDVFEKAILCNVTVSQVEGTGEKKNAGNGFVAHCNEQFTVVAVHPSFQFQGLVKGKMINGPKATVKFCDNTVATDTTFIKLEHSLNLVVARIALGHWEEATYGKLDDVLREDVLSIVSLFTNIIPFIGRVISPRSTSVNARGKEIAGSRERFAFNLPAAGHVELEDKPNYQQKFELMKNQVLGGPVFNFNGQLVGFVDRCGHNFDFKFGVRVQELEAVILKWLSGREWADAIKAHRKLVQKAGGVQSG